MTESKNNDDLDYAEVMNDYYEWSERVGKTSDEAWLDLDGVWWPNPYYTGEPVAHPEADNVFHPDTRPSLRERYEKSLDN